MKRPKKLSLKKYFQARILHSDNRFAKNISYLFYAQFRCEAKDTRDCLSIAMRKGRDQDITAGDLREKMSGFIRNDLAIHFLQKVRGSPAYFNKLFYDLLGMIRQLGPATWFVTLSAADLKWYDTIQVIARQQGIDLTDDELDNMSWEQRCGFLRSNPVTAARHFDNRLQIFLRVILLNKKLLPLGNVIAYKMRIEFQLRGSPHVHMLLWTENAPSINNNSSEDVEAFVDRYVFCQLPEDEDLHNLLLTVQRHTHSAACRKHGQTCRFNFPRPPCPRTIVAVPESDVLSTESEEKNRAILGAVQEQLDKLNHNNEESLQHILRKAGVEEEQYIQAVKWKMTKNGQPAVLLKRNVSEMYINIYNQTLMKAWEANLDVQFVTKVYACVMYLASYISKPERTLGDVLKSVSSSSQHLGPKSSMRATSKKFLSHREISAQEAVYRILPLPLTQGSHQVLFLATDLPENRTRLFKPLKLIEVMDDDDPDVFQVGIYCIKLISMLSNFKKRHFLNSLIYYSEFTWKIFSLEFFPHMTLIFTLVNTMILYSQ